MTNRFFNRNLAGGAILDIRCLRFVFRALVYDLTADRNGFTG